SACMAGVVRSTSPRWSGRMSRIRSRGGGFTIAMGTRARSYSAARRTFSLNERRWNACAILMLRATSVSLSKPDVLVGLKQAGDEGFPVVELAHVGLRRLSERRPPVGVVQQRDHRLRESALVVG